MNAQLINYKWGMGRPSNSVSNRNYVVDYKFDKRNIHSTQFFKEVRPKKFEILRKIFMKNNFKVS